MSFSLPAEHSENIFRILTALLQSNTAFAVGREATEWAHGLRFTIYDVRSGTSAPTECAFDTISVELEEALKDSGYLVTAIMKGARLCMVDIDCRAHQTAGSVS